MNAHWTIGITHLVKPPFDPEMEAFDGSAEFVYFDARNENSFNVSDLKKLDAFLVWTPPISRKTTANLKTCKILVRYGVGFDKVDVGALTESGIMFSNNRGSFLSQYQQHLRVRIRGYWKT